MKILSFTTLFPNSIQPGHGVFVANRLRRLAETGEAEVRVVAPVPWIPPGTWWARRYGRYRDVPRTTFRDGIAVDHPRYMVIPRVGMNLAPILLALSQYLVLSRIIRGGYDFDIIDAHYFYPDGVAAALLGYWLNKPVVITGRGSDLNLIPSYSVPRRQIQWAAGRAAAMITVCQALKQSLIDLGIEPERVTVLRNGVDLALFRPYRNVGERAAERARYGMTGLALVSVGQLIERKGNHLIVDALKNLPGAHLYLAGEGPEREALMELAAERGVAGSVHLLGPVPHEELPRLYAAADALILASSREGWANVLLESMACGTPVIATRVWGTPEVVAAPAAGILMSERSVAGVINGVESLFRNLPSRSETRAYAEKFSWNDTTAGQLSLFREIVRAAPI